MTKIWWILIRALKSLKKSFLVIFDLKKLSFMTLESDAKFEEKLTCGLENNMKNLANFHQSTWKSQNWDFDGILLSKVENVWAENLQGSYVSWQWRMMQKLKRNWLVSSKLKWGIWRILIPALENLKNLHFNGPFLIKVYNVWAEKVQRSYIWWHWRMMQNLKKNIWRYLCFLK